LPLLHIAGLVNHLNGKTKPRPVSNDQFSKLVHSYLIRQRFADTLKQLFVVTVEANILKRIILERQSANGARYWRYEYDLVIWFGGTELRAQVVWKENVSSFGNFALHILSLNRRFALVSGS
jgi:hypothetical protein